MDIKELGKRLSMYEDLDMYDLKSVIGDLEYSYVTELERDGKKYEAWFLHEKDSRGFCGKQIKDEKVYQEIADKLREKFPNEDIQVTSRQYKYAPEQVEYMILLPIERGENFERYKNLKIGDKLKIEGYADICEISDKTEDGLWEIKAPTADGGYTIFDLYPEDIEGVEVVETTNEEWLLDGNGFIEIDVPSEVVDSICTMGSNDAAVEEACEMPKIRQQLDAISDEDIDKAFREIGFDKTDAEIDAMSRKEKEHYLIWDLAWNAFDDTDRQIDESVEDEVKDHKNLAPEVDADKLKKEIENKKEEKPKMALTKKLWKEITGKIDIDKEEKKITKQVEESIAGRIVSELDKINEDDIAVFNCPDEELYEVSAKIVKYPTGYYINFLDGKDGNGNLISQAGSYESEEEAREMLKKLRTDYKEI